MKQYDIEATDTYVLIKPQDSRLLWLDKKNLTSFIDELVVLLDKIDYVCLSCKKPKTKCECSYE